MEALRSEPEQAAAGAPQQDPPVLNCLCGKRWKCKQTVGCTECHDKYHLLCLGIEKHQGDSWEWNGWRCLRCLVRWHVQDALQKVVEIVTSYAADPLGIRRASRARADLLASGLGTRTMTEDAIRMDSLLRAGEGRRTRERVGVWMRQLVEAMRRCSLNGPREIELLGHPTKVKDALLLQVVYLAQNDPELAAADEVGEVIQYLAMVLWGARLLCQLRRRPTLPDLQALTARMETLRILNAPLHGMLRDLINRSMRWIGKARPALQQAWQRPDIPIDVQYLKSLRREKRDIPVRLVLERRIKMMLLELPPRRFCRCRGFNDGLLMLRCEACKEWFHGKCVQVQDGELPQDRGYMCEECCRVEGRPYPWPPYRPPDIEAELAESVELAGHDEAEEDDAGPEVNRCLEGIWPSAQRLAELSQELMTLPQAESRPAPPPAVHPPPSQLAMGHSGPAHSAMTRPLTIASLREAALAEMRQTQASEPPTHYLHGAGQSLRSTDSEPMPYFSYLAGGPSSYVGPGALDAARDMSRWGPDMAAMLSGQPGPSSWSDLPARDRPQRQSSLPPEPAMSYAPYDYERELHMAPGILSINRGVREGGDQASGVLLAAERAMGKRPYPAWPMPEMDAFEPRSNRPRSDGSGGASV